MKVSRQQDGDSCFFAPLRNNSEFDSSRIKEEDHIGQAALREENVPGLDLNHSVSNTRRMQESGWVKESPIRVWHWFLHAAAAFADINDRARPLVAQLYSTRHRRGCVVLLTFRIGANSAQ
jgi:hypothetical protein